ncbi:hypothetical protein GQ473_07290 [archaeon]|nr:hypothetical protein [archaeon]
MTFKIIKKKSMLIIAISIIFAIIFGVVMGYLLFGNSDLKNVVVQNPIVSSYSFSSVPYTSSGQALMYLPAVMRNDTGVSAHVIVSAKKGTGRITTNINNVLVADDTQQSIRMAVLVAGIHEGIDIDTIDVNYDIYADASTLEGPSAGAAFTITTIAALRDEKLKNDVMITGTINHDGTIGPAGKIFEKASAAKAAGSSVLLVPLGASSEINYTQSEFCYMWGTYNYCQFEFVPETIDISDDTGIEIIEVETVDDVLGYFLD